jgi:Xaa-Pro dipeptidase
MDDQHAPFRTNPQLMQWLPLAQHPDACLVYRPGETPRAIVIRPDTFWEEPPDAPGSPWSDSIDTTTVNTPDKVLEVVGELPARTAILGPPVQVDQLPVPGDRNPVSLVRYLDYQRAWKTPYEIACMRGATGAAVAGHLAAREAFVSGASEFDILLEFQRGSSQPAARLPYPPIIGIAPHGAILHYQHYRQTRRAGPGLLIDAGCEELGYASDITRTHVLDEHADFTALRDDLDGRQQALCNRVREGIAFGDLHHAAHEEIAGVLCRQDLFTCSPEAAIERQLTHHFFPHGLGHLLGLQVHDVGGWQAGPDGGQLAAPAAYPRLRLLRTLEAGFVLTIEPGIYFIDSLLAELREKPEAADVNWEKVAALRPYGGIRIEDNVLVTADGHENLTRQAFATAR